MQSYETSLKTLLNGYAAAVRESLSVKIPSSPVAQYPQPTLPAPNAVLVLPVIQPTAAPPPLEQPLLDADKVTSVCCEISLSPRSLKLYRTNPRVCLRFYLCFLRRSIAPQLHWL